MSIEHGPQARGYDMGDEFTGRVCVIAPYPLPTDTMGILKGLLRGTSVFGSYVTIFSDIDLAERHIAEHGAAHTHKPLSLATMEDFTGILLALEKLGDTHVGVDPGTHVRRVEIQQFVRGIRSASQNALGFNRVPD